MAGLLKLRCSTRAVGECLLRAVPDDQWRPRKHDVFPLGNSHSNPPTSTAHLPFIPLFAFSLYSSLTLLLFVLFLSGVPTSGFQVDDIILRDVDSVVVRPALAAPLNVQIALPL